MDLLRHTGMSDCHSLLTPVDTSLKLSATNDEPLSDATDNRSIASSLRYLTLTSPTQCIKYVFICMLHSRLTRLSRSVFSGTSMVLWSLRFNSTHSPPRTRIAYSDADWAGCPDCRRSTLGYYIYYGDTLISRSSKRHTTLSRSFAESTWLLLIKLLTAAGSHSFFRNCTLL
jgi:hypothetical protein